VLERNPARAAGLDDRGRIEPGARADLVAVGRRSGCPTVAGAWVAGRQVR
jgi:alpha-D-ribose 1-methylphosphonate 5-triphosphate diphosphatase